MSSIEASSSMLSHSHVTKKISKPLSSHSTSESCCSVNNSQATDLHAKMVDDFLTIEEPMEIIIEQELPMGIETTSIYVTMRTPGQDIQLAKGFLFSEGFIEDDCDIISIKHCGPTIPPYQLQNIIKVTLLPSINWKNKRSQRQVQGNSSCGLCGVTSLQAVKMGIKKIHSQLTIHSNQLLELERNLHKNQPLFSQTGGIHAVSLFNGNADWVMTFEDIGRHNAMDKLIGYALERKLLPLNNHAIITTSRASFELVQKSARAGCALLAAVSAPSSLAVQLAQDVNQTLIGFLRRDRFNVYADQSNRIRVD